MAPKLDEMSKGNQMTQIEAVLFDVDDTLFDRNKAQDLVLEIIVREMPAIFEDLDYDEVRRAFAESDRISSAEYYSGTLQEGFRTRRSKLFLEFLRLDRSLWEEIAALYVKRYPTVYSPVGGLPEVIDELAKTYKLGVVSNGFPDVQYRKLETLRIRERFGCIVLSEEVDMCKPEPAIFHHAAALLNVPPHACVYVGDLFDMDVVGAKRAGMRACWLNPSGAPRPIQGIVPDAEIQELAGLPPILKTM